MSTRRHREQTDPEGQSQEHAHTETTIDAALSLAAGGCSITWTGAHRTVDEDHLPRVGPTACPDMGSSRQQAALTRPS